MAGLTNYAEEKALNRLLRGDAFTPPASLYFGLYSTYTAGETSGGTEMTGTGYGRQNGAFGAYASRQIASSGTIAWTAGSDWGAAPGLGIWDASTGGNLLYTASIAPVPTITNGATFSFLAGEIVIEITKLGPYLAQRVLELLLKNTAHGQITGIKAHLYTAAPSDDGTGGTELAAGDYAAQNVAFNAYDSATGRCNVSADISYTAAAGSAWGALPAMAFKSGSNFLGQTAITPLPTVAQGAAFALQGASTFIGID